MPFPTDYSLTISAFDTDVSSDQLMTSVNKNL